MYWAELQAAASVHLPRKSSRACYNRASFGSKKKSFLNGSFAASLNYSLIGVCALTVRKKKHSTQTDRSTSVFKIRVSLCCILGTLYRGKSDKVVRIVTDLVGSMIPTSAEREVL